MVGLQGFGFGDGDGDGVSSWGLPSISLEERSVLKNKNVRGQFIGSVVIRDLITAV